MRNRYTTYSSRFIYSLLPAFLLFSFSLSLRNLRKIFPDGDFGISSMNSTPPVIHLYRALCCSTCFCMSRLMTRSLSSSPTDGDLTTNAFGTSPDFSSGTWITAQSLTDGCVKRWASSSAGATWWPCNFISKPQMPKDVLMNTLTLINSFMRSTIKICSLPEGAFLMTASSPVRM